MKRYYARELETAVVKKKRAEVTKADALGQSNLVEGRYIESERRAVTPGIKL